MKVCVRVSASQYGGLGLGVLVLSFLYQLGSKVRSCVLISMNIIHFLDVLLTEFKSNQMKSKLLYVLFFISSAFNSFFEEILFFPFLYSKCRIVAFMPKVLHFIK